MAGKRPDFLPETAAIRAGQYGALPALARFANVRLQGVEIDADGIATITFDAPDAPVNTMTLAWQRDLAAAAAQASADKERLRGVLLASAKQTFFAGAALCL